MNGSPKNTRPQPFWLWRIARTIRIWPIGQWLQRRVPPHRAMIDGFDFALEPARNYQDWFLWIWRRPVEAETIGLLAEHVGRPGAIFYDIGGNCGTFSLWLGRQMSASGTLRVFEPNPDMAARLRGNLERAALAVPHQLHQVALGPEDGEMALTLGQANLGMSTLLEKAEGEQVNVAVKRLADFPPPRDRQGPFVIKIDVEGYEDQVLGPFLDAMPPSEWPDVLCLEISHAEDWQFDLLGKLARCGYTRAAEPDENGIFLRKKS